MNEQKSEKSGAGNGSAQTMERLTVAMERLYSRYSGWVAFRNGIYTGLGTTIGVALVVTFIAWVIARFEFVPGIDRLSEVLRDYTKR